MSLWSELGRARQIAKPKPAQDGFQDRCSRGAYLLLPRIIALTKRYRKVAAVPGARRAPIRLSGMESALQLAKTPQCEINSPSKSSSSRRASMTHSETEKDFAALEHMRRARMIFGTRICEASATVDEDVLEDLRLDSMYEFAEFYFTLDAMGFTAPDDISIIADMHDQRIEDLLKNERAMRQRKLRKDRLLDAILTSDVRPRLEQCWREAPGSLDQANLGRFLLPQMSAETTRKLIVASTKAGFLTRTPTIYGSIVVASTGVMEKVFGGCLREMRLAIAAL